MIKYISVAIFFFTNNLSGQNQIEINPLCDLINTLNSVMYWEVDQVLII